MGMQDRDWYKEDFKRRQGASGGFSRPNVVIRSRFAPGFVLGALVGAGGVFASGVILYGYTWGFAQLVVL